MQSHLPLSSQRAPGQDRAHHSQLQLVWHKEVHPETLGNTIIHVWWYVCFHGSIDGEERRQLSRYIIACNGDITDTVDSSTTHLLCKKDDSQVRYWILCTDMGGGG